MSDMHTDHGSHPVHSTVHHEEKDINVRAVMVGTVIFVVLTVIMLIGLWGLFVGFRWLDRSLDPEKISAVAEDANEVSLLEGVDPEVPAFVEDWVIGVENKVEREHAENKVMNEWGWVDQVGGRVRLPIEQAKALALANGYPVRGSTSPQVGAPAPWWMSSSDEEPVDDNVIPINRDIDEASLDQGEGMREASGQ